MKIENIRRIILSGEENDILVKARALLDEIEDKSEGNDDWYMDAVHAYEYLDELLDYVEEEH